ncbi:WecB/TagA/CpsF family glycosyltransferase [Azospirillum sp. TSO22-1]|uniref:WecB/TagA/CpsF family glycosyltransferase n=1 Tax=Azospirillum sp. TSO22-1 TaxID=716789 RepID=UPI001FFE59B6|nr:WecB/TagA/CpsF family glycosyltransferase [Azospirillum sp. TSO22-1]
MTNPREVLTLIDNIRLIHSDEQRRDLIRSLGKVDRPTILSFVNVHAVNLCWSSATVYDAFRASDVVLRDGIGLSVALKALGIGPGLNMNGTDFIPLLLQTLPKRRLAVYGTATPWLERARIHLENTTPHIIADMLHGFHPAERYLESARRHRPDVIVLAMGMPRQEEMAVRLRQSLDHPVLIVNGGAIVDFMARRFDRAPVVFQRLGLEWAYRMAQEPRRLYRRYVHGGFRFARNLMLLRRAASARQSGAQAQGV